VNSFKSSAVRGAVLAAAAFVLLSPCSRAQQSGADATGAIRDLQDQVHQLHDLVEQMRAENAESRAEMKRLRQDLQATRALLESPAGGGALRSIRDAVSIFMPGS